MASIKHLFHINGPKEEVYNALTSIDGLSNWWTVQTSGEASLNGALEFRFGELGCNKMKITALKPGELVKWECIDGPGDWIGTKISFQLDEKDGKTRVRFEHAGWKEENDFFGACSFSWGRYMESLRQLCQAGKGEAFGSEGYRR